MKITNVKTFDLSVALDNPFKSATMDFDKRNSLLVKVETDKGVVGWGEAGQFGPSAPPKTVIEDVLRPVIINENPYFNEELWRKMYNYTRDYGQKGSIIEGISGIDIALWDIKGKILGVPIYNLLGAKFRDRVVAYATGLYYKESYNLEDYVRDAKKIIEKGFKAIKIKIGSREVKEDLKIISALRKELNDDILMMVDANHAYNALSAIKIGKELEDYDIFWLEEPVIPEDIQSYKEVKSKLDTIAIAGGECEFTQYGFKKIIEQKAMDIVQPDVCVTGGFTACKKIIDLADLYGIKVIPHIWGSAVAMYASLQLLAYIPDNPFNSSPYPGNNQPLFEYDQSENPLRHNFVGNPLELINGEVIIPDKPGLGLEIDEDKIKKMRH